MSARKASLLGIGALVLSALLPTAATAAPSPAWRLNLSSHPTHFIAGKNGRYLLIATNVGAGTAEGTIALKDTLPAGLTLQSAFAFSSDPAAAPFSCTALAQTISCEGKGPVHAGFSISAEIRLSAGSFPDPSTRGDEAEISGGGAAGAAVTTLTTISATPPPFDFLSGEEGFRAPTIDEEGLAAKGAGSHPYEQVVDLNFPTVEPAGLLTGAGHLRDATVDLPPGMIGNPTATPVLCTEAELITQNEPGCPSASAVGTVTATTDVGGGIGPQTSPLYNMVPPPGAPAAFGFNAAGAGIFVHLLGEVRSDGDYGISGTVNDTIARGLNPVFGASAELWGNPSAKAHDYARGNCLKGKKTSCPVEPQETAFLSLPGECPGEEPPLFRAHADSWEEPGSFHEATYESADLSGELPAPIEGCGGLEFKPKIQARPTTDVADSPSGLDFDLHQPQQTKLAGAATASVRDVKITFPPGLAVNPSAADGLGACSAQQIGLTTKVGDTPIHFSKVPVSCPDAAKIGTVTATTPLLAQYNEKHEVMHDPEGNAIPEPLHGSLYLAKPFDNPFDSLIAIYLTIEDEKTGTVAKLASEVEPNPLTGQLSTRLTESPQLPVEDLKVHLFGGDRGGLQTPVECGSHTTTSDLVPWSTPEGATEHPADSFQITAEPGGGSCPSEAARAPHSPTVSAGTLSPQAGSYSPLLFKLSRQDGSQRLAGLILTLPPGLSAKLAGVGECSEAQIAAAKARGNPNEGALEQANPSCPAASEVGVVDVAAGAGPAPLHVQGHAYLAGPYRGAPLSAVIIAPAVAGPFDLGAVVVRSAIYLDPTTAQARAVSDPFPQILHGIPVDLRSASLQLVHPNFTLNPTSCNEKTIAAQVTSTLGQIAPLAQRFQVGGCAALPFKPELSARLFGPIHRGAHPRFRAVLSAKAGEAGIARTVVALPRSEFIDQGHFRTICTRVQFAANQCPSGSVYGHVRAFTPLLDFPLEGPVYLRSSSHQLPDVVAALRGPPAMPIALDAVGRVDSINGGVRTSFETVPDAPVSKVIIAMQGKKKGLFQNSTNICNGTHRVTVKMDGQNGKTHDTTPALKASCPKAKNPQRH